MVTYRHIRDADVAALSTLRDAWSVVSARLGDAASHCQSLTETMAGGGWQGTAADAGAARFTELSRLVSAGETESTAIGEIIGEGVTTFTRERDALMTVVNEIHGIEQLRISDTGQVSVVVDDTASANATELYQSWRQSYQESIDSHVESATEADSRVAEALQLAAEATNTDDSTFNDTAMNLDQIEQAEQDAESAAGLMAGDPREMSTEDWEQLRQLMSQNGDNPVFAQRLLTEMGPQGLVENYGTLVHYAANEDDADLLARMRDIEAGMGHALATATHPDTEPPLDDGFLEEFMTVGATSYLPGSQVEVDPHLNTITGYGIIAPLLEHGEYHEDFLVPVAEHITRLSENGYIADGELSSEGTSRAEYTLEDDEIAHPMNPVMEALADNPSASLSYFNGSADYDHLDYPASAYALTGESGSMQPLPGLDNDDRVDWALNFANEYSDVTDSSDFGDAVTAAATGVPEHADPATTIRPQHTPQMSAIADQTIDYVSEHADQFEPDAGLSGANPAMGRLGANYMEDIHNVYTQNTTSGATPPTITVDDDGDPTVAFDDRGNVNDFLSAIAADPDAYASIKGASLGVLAQTVIPTMELSQTSEYVEIDNMSVGHAHVLGATDQGWADIVQDEHFEDAENQNSFLGNLSGAANMIGLAHPAAGGAAITLDNVILGPMQEGNLADAEAAADQSEDDITAQAKTQHLADINGTVFEVLRANGYSVADAEAIAGQVGASFDQTYGSGQNEVD